MFGNIILAGVLRLKLIPPVSPSYCRYVIDLYEAEVPQKYMREICEGPMRRAQVEVRKA